MRQRHTIVSSRTRVLSSLFALLLLTVGFAAYRVAREAQAAVLDSSSGSTNATVLDPTAPGFRAFTEPTPTALVLHTTVTPAGRAELVGLSFLAATNPNQGGTLLTMPASLISPVGANTPFDEMFRMSGLTAVVNEASELLGVGFGDVVVLDSAAWTSLMTADLPLAMSLRDDLRENVTDTEFRVLLSAATRSFELSEIALIASHRNPGEASLAAARRQQEIWRAWISRTAASAERPELFDIEVGFVDVIDALARGEVSYRTIPTGAGTGSSLAESTYRADVDGLRDLISSAVPLPLPNGSRIDADVMLLDGTGGAADQAPALRAIVRGGGRVVIVGNSDSSTIVDTTVQAHDRDAIETARAIATELQTGEPTFAPLQDPTVAITVILGADRLDVP